MIHAPSAVTPLDPERIEVGDAIGPRRSGAAWFRARRGRRAAEVAVLTQHGHQVPAKSL
jgi:hypothetical protein